MLKRSLLNILLCGTILTAIPLIAVASHNHIESSEIRFSVPATFSSRVDSNSVNIWSEINELHLSDLNGTNNVKPGDTVFVSLARGPDDMVYPFAVTSEKAVSLEIDKAFLIRGTVTDKQKDRLVVRYSFESFVPQSDLAAQLYTNPTHEGRVQLVLNSRSQPRVRSVTINGVTYPHRVIDAPLLKGFTQ